MVLDIPADNAAVAELRTARASPPGCAAWLPCSAADEAASTAVARLRLPGPVAAVLVAASTAVWAPVLQLGAVPALVLAAIVGRGDEADAHHAVQWYCMWAAAVTVCSVGGMLAGAVKKTSLTNAGLGGVGLLVSVVAFYLTGTSAALALYVLAHALLFYPMKVLAAVVRRQRPYFRLAAAQALPPQATSWAGHVSSDSKLDNDVLSFPSASTASAGVAAATIFVYGVLTTMESTPDASLSSCVWQGLTWVPLWMWLFVAVVCVARVWFLAHHVMDTAVGVALGMGTTVTLGLLDAVLVDPSYGRTWLVSQLVTLVVLAALVAPLVALKVPHGGLTFYAMLAVLLTVHVFVATFPRFSIGAVLVLSASVALISVLNRKLCMACKPWTTATIGRLFKELKDPAFAPEVAEVLAKKRKEFLEECTDPDSVFPGNFYIIGSGLGVDRLALSWQDIRVAMRDRLDWMRDKHGVDLQSIDVVLGVYSGGAFVAPITADLLDRPVAYVRVNRFKTKLSLWLETVLKCAKQLLCGLSKYAPATVTRLPDPALIAGKTVLVVDDAAVSGLTLEAAAEHCYTVGAKHVIGTTLGQAALWTRKRYFRTGPHRSMFTPWGTY